jgi:hypothetical protein
MMGDIKGGPKKKLFPLPHPASRRFPSLRSGQALRDRRPSVLPLREDRRWKKDGMRGKRPMDTKENIPSLNLLK